MHQYWILLLPLIVSCSLFESSEDNDQDIKYEGEELKLEFFQYDSYTTEGNPISNRVYFEYDEFFNLKSLIRRSPAWDIVQQIDLSYNADTVSAYHILNVRSTATQDYEYDTIRNVNGWWISTFSQEEGPWEIFVKADNDHVLEKHVILDSDTISSRYYSFDFEGNLVDLAFHYIPSEKPSFDYSGKTKNPFKPLNILSAFNYPLYFSYHDLSSSSFIPFDFSLYPNFEWTVDSLDRLASLTTTNNISGLSYTTSLKYIN
jgi:hypothetical protein